VGQSFATKIAGFYYLFPEELFRSLSVVFVEKTELRKPVLTAGGD
jgi:hypothetical protein